LRQHKSDEFNLSHVIDPVSNLARQFGSLAMSRSQIRNVTGDSFFAWEGEVLVVNILGKPSAVRAATGKPKGTQLKVSVTAAPVAGKATDHMLRFLAPHFGVNVAGIEVVFGRENVSKQLRIQTPKKLPAVFTPAPLPTAD
jgi:uncharacterized protein YggU (UPF0235/DUF167 family)